jgi:hydrogenase maturation protease
MSSNQKQILILGVGNDILGDDAVGLIAARALQDEFQESANIVEAAMGGLQLMELLEGYKKVLILDAIVTAEHPYGTILELSKEEFKHTVAIAPHMVSLPESLQLAEKLGIPFPEEIRILAMEIENPYELREGLSPSVEQALPEMVSRARVIVRQMQTI